MEQFIAEVGPTSTNEPKKIESSLLEIAELVLTSTHAVLTFCDEEYDDLSSWIYYGVGGPA